MNFSFFDSLLDSVLVVDEKQNISYVNEITASLCGLSLKRLKKCSTLNEIFTFDPPLLEIGLKEITSATPYFEVKVIFQKSLEGHVRLSIQPEIPDSVTNLRWIIFLRDLSMEVTLEKKYNKEKREKAAVLLFAQRD